jgi:NAD(P)-dependent dehydrogenase (short-subunit alcohol dehydrogenase family)
VHSLKGQTIVVMGGTSGIALAAARRLGALDATVVVTGRDGRRAEKITENHAELEVALVDATSGDALKIFFDSRLVIDHLVLCVSGSKGSGQFRHLSTADLREGFDLKFFAQFQAAQAALASLRKDGSITFVSAISARAANPGTGRARRDKRSDRSHGQTDGKGASPASDQRGFTGSRRDALVG